MSAFLTVALFYLLIFSIGIYASRRQGNESAQDVFIAGRRMPLWIGVLTMTATWVDGGYLNGTAEAVYGRGLVWAQAPWGFALSLLLGGTFFAKVMHERHYTTLLDPFQQRYGAKIGALFYLPAFCGELLWTSGILAALGTTFGVLLHIDFRIAIVVSATMTIGYTVRGGLWSIAYTDVAQLTLALGGMALCVPFALGHFASIGEVWSLYQAKFGTSTNLIPPLDGSWGLQALPWMDSMALLVMGGIPWHCYFQRVLSSPTPADARRLSYWAAALCVLMAIPPALLGMIGAVFDWAGHGLPSPAGDFLILPTVLRDLTPGWVGILGLCAVAGAIMSSVDASIFSAASMFSWNIGHQLLGAEADPQKLAASNRRAIVVIGAMATGIALSVHSIYALWYLSADLVYVLLFPQLLIVLYAKRVSPQGVLAGLAVGLFLRVGGGEPALGLPALLPYGSWFPFKTLAMLSGWGTTALVSRLDAASLDSQDG